MIVQDRLAIVDRLLAQPFPGEGTRDGSQSSGPGFHVYVLQASQEFWDDRSEEVVEPAQAEIDAAFQDLAAGLTARWGEPQVVDLEPYLWSDDEVPEPMARLCMLTLRLSVWRPPGTDRWVGLAVGQADAEFAIELLLATGDAEFP
ncbi:hypothetical protein ACFPIJ_52740 [Dactylosporangium cerinum]|uniref:Uncharacterized protein n=1 Tax=Dactylosporangium cerinum TaxID=1434730 RepID=A0ABV9WCJ7_9ACTN